MPRRSLPDPFAPSNPDPFDHTVGRTRSKTARDTCFHSDPGMILVEEAEQLSIYLDDRKGEIHICVQVDGWFACRMWHAIIWQGLDEADRLAHIATYKKDLEMIAR